MATGSELLSYKGDAALAIGSDAEAAGLYGFDRQGVEGINDSLEKAMQHQLVWNTMLYHQAIKDRDDTFDLFAQQDVDFPVREEDSKVLQEKIDGIKKKLIETPNIRANRQAFIAVQSDINALKGLKASAKTRYASAAALQQAAATEINPIKKQKMQEHLNSELKKGVDHQIDPYSETVSWDEKTFAPIQYQSSFETSLGKDGVPYKAEVKTPIMSSWTKHYSMDGVVTGEKKNLPYEILDFYNQQTNNPNFRTKEWVEKTNAKLQSVNEISKAKPGDPDFVKPIGTVAEDGTVQFESMPADFVKSFDVASRYAVTRGAPVVDEERLKGQKMLTEMEENKAQAYSARKQGDAATTNASANMLGARARAKEIDTNIEKLKVETENLRIGGDKARYELKRDQLSAMQETKDSKLMFLTEAATDKGYMPAKTLLLKGKVPERAQADLEQLGIDSTWKAKDLGRGTETMRKALSVLTTEMVGANDLTGQPANKQVKRVDQPYRVAMLKSPDGDPNKMRLVGYDKNGQIMNAVDANEAGLNMIREASGFANDLNYIKKSAAYRMSVEEEQGSTKPGYDITAQPKTTQLPDGRKLIEVGDEVRDPSGKVLARKINGVWVEQ